MEYGYYIEITSGEKIWFTEGCTYCRMSTGGQHEPHCPLYKLTEIRKKSHLELGEAWQRLAKI